MSAILRKYGAATTILFPLIDRDAIDFEATPVVHVAGDTTISKDEGAFVNTANAFVHEGKGIYSIALSATEMQAARIVVTVVDQGTKAWEDQAILLETYGHASAQHAFDLNAATPDANVVSVAAGAITAGAIATDAIGAAELAADAVAEIADSVWDEAVAGHVGVGSFGEEVQMHATSGEMASVQADTDNIQTRLPAALVGGRMDSDVGAMQAGVLTAAAIATDAITAAKIAADALGASEFAQGAADKIWVSATRTLTAIAGGVLDAAELNNIADALLKRDVDQVEATAALHSLTTAILKAVSRVRDNAGTLETYRTDGATVHLSQAITTDDTNEPIDELGVGS